MTEIGERAKGRWRDILASLGAAPRSLSGKNAPCPFCGGKDRFRFINPETGYFICNQCGQGDGFDYARRLLKVEDFKLVANAIEKVIGGARKQTARPVDKGKRRAALNSLWGSGEKISPDDPAGRYLDGRGLSLPNTDYALRWSQKQGAMLARVFGQDGKPATLQQTFLTKLGEKIERKTFWGEHPKGSAVRLRQLCGSIMGIAEGCETAMAAQILYGPPVWAALDAMHLASFEPPPGIETVVIYADNDASFTGHAAAYALANKLVVQKKLKVKVRLPDHPGQDWNDVLIESLPQRKTA